MTQPILQVSNLKKFYDVKTGIFDKLTLKVINGVSFSVMPKTTLGIVGESGCGKSTLAKTIMQIVSPTEGEMLIDGVPYQQIDKKNYRKKIQMIFQDPYRSLNPRKKAIDIISEPLLINSAKSKSECHEIAISMMKRVGLRPDYANRYPHMFSGGQRQRIGVARALVMQPEIVVCDEPVSALDVSIQAQVINLLMDLQNEFGLTYLFISHDLSVVRHLADNVMVMYLGEIVEYGTRDQIFFDPQHPYTKMLLASTPQVRKEFDAPQVSVKGELPSIYNPPTGCTFQSRCPIARQDCKLIPPSLEDKHGRKVSCHLV